MLCEPADILHTHLTSSHLILSQTNPGIVKHIDGLNTEQIQKIGIPNGIPLVYKFDRNMKPIVQPKAVFPLSGEYLEKKVTALQSTVLYCTVLYYVILYCTVLYYVILFCTVLYCLENFAYSTFLVSSLTPMCQPPPLHPII